MASLPIKPLRIQKSSSELLDKRMNGPLSEVSPMGIRRNSPSYNQIAHKLPTSNDSSPFDASPNGDSSRSHWRESESPSRFRGSENAPPSPGLKMGLTRRSSLEKLQKASRVKNSNMFALEHSQNYNPLAPAVVERPLLKDRSSGLSTLDNFRPSDSHTNVREPAPTPRGHRRSESHTKIPIVSPQRAERASAGNLQLQQSLNSPFKSSIADGSRTAIASKTESSGSPASRSPNRQAKTVSFDQAPPQINEYETITPGPSSLASGSREGSYDPEPFDMDEAYGQDDSFGNEDSFDASLEDADKTPVVLPEDWRFMKPGTADSTLARDFEDPFRPSATESEETIDADGDSNFSGSVDSNGERRPLPPLPSIQRDGNSPSKALSPDSPSSTTKTPRPASISKADIMGMKTSTAALEDRMRQLQLQQQAKIAVKDCETGSDNESDSTLVGLASKAQKSSQHKVVEQEDDTKPPEISRSSILQDMEVQKVTRQERMSDELDRDIDYQNLDPDEAIPSRETSSVYMEGVDKCLLKKEHDYEDSTAHLYDMPEYDEEEQLVESNGYEVQESSVIHHHTSSNDVLTGGQITKTTSSDRARMSLPEFESNEDDWGSHFQSFMSEIPQQQPFGLSLNGQLNSVQASKSNFQSFEEATGRPFSSNKSSGDASAVREAIEATEVVPNPVATIRASGGKLKTRHSATAAEVEALNREAVFTSDEEPPSIPSEHLDNGNNKNEPEETPQSERDFVEAFKSSSPRKGRRKSGKLSIDMPLEESNEELGRSLNSEFERVIDGSKKNYLMRQNTKVIVASTRSVSNENSEADAKDTHSQETAKCDEKSSNESPRKPSAPAITTEPWNGRMRRQSTRRQSILPDKGFPHGIAPPLPGHESNATTTLESVKEDCASVTNANEPDAERGRLFLKVVGVKDLDIPLPRNERSWFQLTLDNGLHCVTTAWLELGKNAPIGQEFELSVFEELDFSLTLHTKLDRPQSQRSDTSSSNPALASTSPSKTKPQKSSALGRIFGSPKKRLEAEKKRQEEEALQRKKELEAQQAAKEPNAWELLHCIIGSDGSFARAIVNLEDYENKAFGRPYTALVPAFNNWATESSTSSTRSKTGGVQRKPPYKIGNLELQLLYVPKPPGTKDEEMPQSMSACAKQLKEAEANSSRQHEGFLSQQGGDCPYWRRRYFKLTGSTLTAYHEMTRQKRANINLAKAKKLVDARTPSQSKGGRRKSVFSEEEEGYMFLEEGFRVRFANGEVIDFYADTVESKEQWMVVLREAVGKESTPEKVTWTTVVLGRERAAALSTKVTKPAPDTTKPLLDQKPKVHTGTRSAPSSPTKNTRPQSSLIDKPTPVLEKGPRHSAVHVPAKQNKETPVPRQPRSEAKNARRQAVKSMVF